MDHGEPRRAQSAVDPEESIGRLLRDLRTRPEGLTTREAANRLEVSGPNELVRHRGPGWPRRLLAQLVHPLALLLWVAAALAWLGALPQLAVAIVVVILVNALFAFFQERHAEKAVEALSAYLPSHARTRRDGAPVTVDARDLVPGDVVIVGEGDRVSADLRLLRGSVEMDISTLNGEAQPVLRTAGAGPVHGTLLEADDLLFSGTSCLGGEAEGVVFATGMRTELGRIAALSQRVRVQPSPLEEQVTRVARLIAVVAFGMGLAFIPLGALFAGLSWADSLVFAIGLLVANVPEGLLPTITLALAVGVRVLAREGALVKRISAVETLGSTSVICTDKTGTLTLNQMRVARAWAADRTFELDRQEFHVPPTPALLRLARAGVVCNNATWGPAGAGDGQGDPTEVALLGLAVDLGVDPAGARTRRVQQFHFDPSLRRMATVDRRDDGLRASVKGAPEAVLPRCTRLARSDVGDCRLTPVTERMLHGLVDQWAAEGLRLLAVAERDLAAVDVPSSRDEVEANLTLLGIVALEDPPRPEVAAAVSQCHDAGIRLVIVTGDHGLTARGIATRVGIGDASTPVVTGVELDALGDTELDRLLEGHRELIFARSSPEAKLRIADALQSQGHVVAMTGDGVNDAPALRRADIGVAMGRSGTEVAQEAATMVLTDDDFATIVSAVRAGRRVYDNVRKFIVYIFAHATPEVVPFLLYALSGGAIPLPLTVMQILAIDLGTETLPALALGREPPEPGLMERPPRDRGHHVVNRVMLMRAWLLLGGVSAVGVLTLFMLTLVEGGWQWGDDVSSGPLHHVWQQATTMSFLAIVACQVGTGIATRTQHAALSQVGFRTNPLLLWGIVFEIVFAAAIVLIPPLQQVFGTATLEWWHVVALLPLPLAVWGVDEYWRWLRRRR